MGPSIEDSNIAFIQPYVSKNQVGYVSFARVFFSVNSVEKVKKNRRIHVSVKGADYIIIMLV